MSRVFALVGLLVCFGASASADEMGAAGAPIDLMPRSLSSSYRLFTPELHVEGPVCFSTFTKPMLDVFDVANKLGCMVIALNDGLDQLGQFLAAAVSYPMHLTAGMLRLVGAGVGTMRVTVAPQPGAAVPTTLSFTPTVVQSGGGFALLAVF
jgi:hypothetical protein